jgi:hypothetical protein
VATLVVALVSARSNIALLLLARQTNVDFLTLPERKNEVIVIRIAVRSFGPADVG